MGILEGEALEDHAEILPLFEKMDGTFPNHEANPLKLDTLEPLQELIRNNEVDFGIAYDGDADRAGFVDEKGNVVPMDMITALIAESALKAKPGGVVFYDLRSSWAVKEVIEESGGIPMMSRVGHAFIKSQMREHNAIFAGELSGHYYFQDNYFAESSSLAALRVAEIVLNSGKTLSELVKPIQRYFASGEINSTVEDPAAVLEKVKANYSDGKVFELDGISVEYDEWWCNVRMSNTEPLVRLNLEAKTKDLMEEKRDELMALIRG
jgi:phosphomannomutase